jgi:hypothetical protein
MVVVQRTETWLAGLLARAVLLLLLLILLFLVHGLLLKLTLLVFILTFILTFLLFLLLLLIIINLLVFLLVCFLRIAGALALLLGPTGQSDPWTVGGGLLKFLGTMAGQMNGRVRSDGHLILASPIARFPLFLVEQHVGEIEPVPGLPELPDLPFHRVLLRTLQRESRLQRLVHPNILDPTL